jgi:hypothetical protein
LVYSVMRSHCRKIKGLGREADRLPASSSNDLEALIALCLDIGNVISGPRRQRIPEDSALHSHGSQNLTCRMLHNGLKIILYLEAYDHC